MRCPKQIVWHQKLIKYISDSLPISEMALCILFIMFIDKQLLFITNLTPVQKNVNTYIGTIWMRAIVHELID
jgi:hypothetical protein